MADLPARLDTVGLGSDSQTVVVDLPGWVLDVGWKFAGVYKSRTQNWNLVMIRLHFQRQEYIFPPDTDSFRRYHSCFLGTDFQSDSGLSPSPPGNET